MARPIKHHRGTSEQDQSTPWELIRFIEQFKGKPFDLDVAATEDNTRAPWFISPESDALNQSWAGCGVPKIGMAWLNPPYANIKPWAKKCSEEGVNDFTTQLLVPAGVGAAWYREYIHPFATTYFLYPRIPFDGWHTTAYNKDIILCEFGPDARPGVCEPLQWISDEEASIIRKHAREQQAR